MKYFLRCVIALALNIVALPAFAQVYPSPIFQNITVLGNVVGPLVGVDTPTGSWTTPPTFWPVFDDARNMLNIGSVASPDAVAVSGQGFLDGLQINHYFGGAAMTGGRQSLIVNSQLRAASNATNANRNYPAAVFFSSAVASDGGTNTAGYPTSKGAMFGINPVAVLYPGATNFLELAGSETNISAQTGSSTWYKVGFSIVPLSTDAVQGAVYDAALAMSAQTGAVGWKNGILFGPMNGQQPIAAAGSLIATNGASTITNGIDFSSYTFTGKAFKSNGFSVDGSGNIISATSMNLNKPASGQANNLTGQMNSVLRWMAVLGNVTAEGGANSGSDFMISGFSDAGAWIGDWMIITRANGQTLMRSTLGSNSITSGGVVLSGGIGVAGAGYFGAEIATGVTTVGALPACNAGRKAASYFVSDATAITYWSAVVGGGANNIRVTCDGTGWKIG